MGLMMSKHAPVPWVADECPDSSSYITIRIADGTANGDTSTCIATVYSAGDAHLIAAAPRMQKLLCAIYEHESHLLSDETRIQLDKLLEDLDV
jgi:hypothetical protein